MADDLTLPGAQKGPAIMSSERKDMDKKWDRISDIMEGADCIRKHGVKYLPKFPDEDNLEYDRRRDCAPWRPEFMDCLMAICAKPFTKEIGFKGSAPETAKDFAEDVDGRGNNQTQFAAEVFQNAVGCGLHVILVDYPNIGENLSRAQEKALGARPYWLHVKARDIVALYTEWKGGEEYISHFRFHENHVERDGFAETVIPRIRVFEPGKWQIWELRDKQKGYELESEGTVSRGSERKTSVPAVLMFTGPREGSLKVKPPLEDLADMQIELYRALSRREEVATFAGAPMLKATGMASDTNITVGPKRVLFTGSSGDGGAQRDFEYIQPNAENIKELRVDSEKLQEDMRRVGLQPLERRTGTITATGAVLDQRKSDCAAQSWAQRLKDVLEQAWVFTNEWVNESGAVEIIVNVDFAVTPFALAPLEALATARTTRDISRDTYWDGLLRFDVLPSDFDRVKEDAALKKEAAEMPPPDPATVPKPTTLKPITQGGTGGTGTV